MRSIVVLAFVAAVAAVGCSPTTTDDSQVSGEEAQQSAAEEQEEPEGEQPEPEEPSAEDSAAGADPTSPEALVCSAATAAGDVFSGGDASPSELLDAMDTLEVVVESFLSDLTGEVAQGATDYLTSDEPGGALAQLEITCHDFGFAPDPQRD